MSFFRTVVDHTGADLKFDIMKEEIPGMALDLVEEGSQMGEDELVANVPVKRGVLKGSIRREVAGLRAEISTNSGYGAFVNDGFPPHIIRARGNNFLRIPVDGGYIFRKQVFHPGFAGHHFKEKTIAGLIPRLQQLGEDMLQRLKQRVKG